MKFIFENGEEVITPSEPKTINLNIEDLKDLFPTLVDNKHLFEFLNLTKDGYEKES
jgi:hypothetical protein